MSEDSPNPYRVEYLQAAKDQIRAIASHAKDAAELREFIGIMKRAVHLMRIDPSGWGDPEYRSKTIDAVACRGLLRPVVFRFVIYEQAHAVVLLSVRLYAEFS